MFLSSTYKIQMYAGTPDVPPLIIYLCDQAFSRKQAGLLGAGAPITLFKLKRAVFDTEKGQLFYN
jgi:hypothetical protein